MGADGRFVIKFYRWGLHPKPGLSEKLNRISKAQIVEVYGRGTSPDGRDYEILEFIKHGTLADFGRGGLPEAKVREVLRELTDAVAALHAENILHRDLKPANVLGSNHRTVATRPDGFRNFQCNGYFAARDKRKPHSGI